MCLGVPGQVVAIDGATALPTGTVDFGGMRRDVCLAYVPEVRVGDHVVVHVGFAISIVDEDEAARTWALLEELTLLDDELAADAQPDPVRTRDRQGLP
jgi:hydrogenase expression/formation protein HypC